MNQRLLLPVFLLLHTCLVLAQTAATHTDVANAFIASLDSAQRKQVVFPFYGPEGREWAFVPNAMSHPPGLALKDMDTLQKQKALLLLQSYLSEKGYQKARSIMDLEYLLQVMEPNSTMRIPFDYVMLIYGTPNPDSTWAWAFQGHHVIFNFTVVKNKVAFTPFFLGSNPGEVKEGPKKGLRLLHEEEDYGFELLNSFSETQRKQAIFSDKAPGEIVTGNARKVSALAPAGISMHEMNSAQRGILNKLLLAYLSSMLPDLAAARYKKIQTEDIDNIFFAWAGSPDKQDGHYYRVQGKTFLIEFDNTQNHANHIHTVWRDFNGDFGRDLLQEHYKEAHHQH